MLPFLKKTHEAGVSMPVDPVKRSPDEEGDYDALESAVQDLFDAFEKKDIQAGCEALRAAFELCDMEPHEEGPHLHAADEI